MRYMAPELIAFDAESEGRDDIGSFIQILTTESDVYSFCMVGVEVNLSPFCSGAPRTLSIYYIFVWTTTSRSDDRVFQTVCD